MRESCPIIKACLLSNMRTCCVYPCIYLPDKNLPVRQISHGSRLSQKALESSTLVFAGQRHLGHFAAPQIQVRQLKVSGVPFHSRGPCHSGLFLASTFEDGQRRIVCLGKGVFLGDLICQNLPGTPLTPGRPATTPSHFARAMPTSPSLSLRIMALHGLPNVCCKAE